MYKEGQIVEVRLSADNADKLNIDHGIYVCYSQIIGYEKPFDWATVKPGMAFNTGWGVGYYIGRDINADYVFSGEFPGLGVGFNGWGKNDLSKFTRAPEHDIEVPK